MKPARWWYHHPTPQWGLRDWLVPLVRYYKCGDEFCNDTLFVRIPLVGHVVIRLNRNIRINNRCDGCVAKYGPWCAGCKGCHRGPRCHWWLGCGHETKVGLCCACGGSYCVTCEPNPQKSCPYRGEQS